MKRATRLSLAALLLALSASGPPGARASSDVAPLGKAANQVWVFSPAGRARNVVVFVHGWSTRTPSGYTAWINHLRAEGSIVIYPRYQLTRADTTTAALEAFQHGIVTAFRSIAPVQIPVFAIGKSFGGSAVFYYAAEARLWGVPAPEAVLSVFPALPLGALPATLLPARMYVELLVGDHDTIAGSAGANAFWQWLAAHPADRKRYSTVRSRPGFLATHNSPYRTDRIARSIYWGTFDALIAAASQHRPIP